MPFGVSAVLPLNYAMGIEPMQADFKIIIIYRLLHSGASDRSRTCKPFGIAFSTLRVYHSTTDAYSEPVTIIRQDSKVEDPDPESKKQQRATTKTPFGG
jgi:hypothetical protein